MILNYLSEQLLVSPHELLGFINTAPYRYKVYEIPKRNNRGSRTIAQPTDILKAMQRMALGKFLSDLPVHSSAMAYREGISIKHNAEAHQDNQYLLKMDFSDFFPSIVSDDLIRHFTRHKGALEQEDELVIKKLFFWAQKKDPSNTHRLSIGAPSSPFISNTLMYEFDRLISDECSHTNTTYTRYADDLVFSTNTKNTLTNIAQKVKELCQTIQYPKLEINTKKTTFSSKKNNRHVTGITLTNNNTISLGHKRKRYIRSLIHKFTLNQLNEEEVTALNGFLSFAKHIEPDFHKAIQKKYGHEQIEAIKLFQKTT